MRHAYRNLIHVLPVIFFAVAGCGDDGGDTGGTATGGAGGQAGSGGQSGSAGGQGVTSDRSYARLVDDFGSEEACLQATSGTGFNCNNGLVLCQNSGFALLLTDIINEGRCTPNGESLLCTVLGPGDLAEDTKLTVTLGNATVDIPEIAGVHPWVEHEMTPDRVAYTADVCEAMTGRFWW
jgi:hypothetical protein